MNNPPPGVYNCPRAAQDAAGCGETYMPRAGQSAEHKIKVMGDKSPKSTQKKSSQKQAKASSAADKKQAAAVSKAGVGKKK